MPLRSLDAIRSFFRISSPARSDPRPQSTKRMRDGSIYNTLNIHTHTLTIFILYKEFDFAEEKWKQEFVERATFFFVGLLNAAFSLLFCRLFPFFHSSFCTVIVFSIVLSSRTNLFPPVHLLHIFNLRVFFPITLFSLRFNFCLCKYY